MCGGRSAPKRNCPLATEGPVYRYRGQGLTLDTRDNFGETGPSGRDLGELARLNDTFVHRAELEDGSVRYTVTAGGSARGHAASLLWLKPMDALLWLTCSSDEACETAKAIVASVKFQNAQEVCGKLKERARRSSEPGRPEAPPPPPPPPPPLPKACERVA